MKKIKVLLIAMIVVLALCSCGIQDEYTEMGFGFEAEGSTVITYFSDGLA